MTHKIILINGPSYSGKDTAGKILQRMFGARQYKMSRPLKDGLREFFCFSYDMMQSSIEVHKDERYNVGLFRTKEGITLTWREVQISLSEEWAKPLFGDDILGRIAVSYLTEPTSFSMTVITDSGFRDETLPLVAAFGADNILLIQLTKQDCSFEGDSRSYIELDDLGVTTVLLDNRYPLRATDDMPITYGMQLGKVLRGWLGEEQEVE